MGDTPQVRAFTKEIEHLSSWNGVSIVEFIAQLERERLKFVAEGASNIVVNFADWGCEDGYDRLEFVFQRMETQAEADDREKRDRDSKIWRDQADRALFERLKKKFEDETCSKPLPNG